MRGPICPKFSGLAGIISILSATGCAAGVDPGPTPEDPRAGRPTTTLSDQSQVDHVRRIVDTHFGDERAQFSEVYRDLSTFVYRDVNKNQILSQWLIDESGHTYWTRACRVGPKGGVLWSTCSSWDLGHDVSDLGLPGFGPIAGMNTYVWTEKTGNFDQQYLAQTVFSERGDRRMGRICPIEREPVNAKCSDWEKLAIDTQQLDVPGASSLRDDMHYSYTSVDGESVVVQSVLSIDGSLLWDRHCVNANASPLVASYKCGFGARAPLKDSGIRFVSAAGAGQYTYQDGDQQVLAQTFLSVDGGRAYNRTCTITEKGVDWNDCSPFTATTISQLRVTGAPL